jgi:hypothetical protein
MAVDHANGSGWDLEPRPPSPWLAGAVGCAAFKSEGSRPRGAWGAIRTARSKQSKTRSTPVPSGVCWKVVHRDRLSCVLAAILVGACWLLGSCTEGESDDAQEPWVTAKSAWCGAVCDYWQRCSGPVRSDCTEYCYTANASYLDATNPEYLVKVAPCIENASCSSEAFERCYDATAPEVATTPAAFAFCRDMAARWFECFYDPDVIECAKNFSSWSATALGRATACGSAACDQLNACLKQALSGGTSA